MEGFNLNVGSESEDHRHAEEEEIAGQDVTLLLTLPDGTVLEETFKGSVNVDWVCNVISGKTAFKFEQISL